MAAHNPFLVNWLKSAYSMEMGLVPVLEKQTVQVKDDPELSRGLDLHLQKTRQHVELLRGCLQRMGENLSAIQPSNPIVTVYGEPDGGAPDRTRQTELLDYVTEAFEVASYRALAALASSIGDEETSRVCDQILQDEMAITQALDRRLPHNGAGPLGAAAQNEGVATQNNVRTARASFDALNSGDLDLWERDLSLDYRGEAPGMPGELNRQQNRAYMQGYLTGFPNLHFEIGRVIAAGDEVVVHWIATGTHTGAMVGPDGRNIPPTGKECRVPGNTYLEFKNDKITRSQVFFDTGELIRQLGLMPGASMTGGAANRGIVHLEIPAADRKVAADFYSSMFGWECEDMGEDMGMGYTTFRTGNIAGGFPDLGDMFEPGMVIPYIESQDIDADLRRAATMGARTLTPKTEIPGTGWFAILADPTGNRIGLFSA